MKPPDQHNAAVNIARRGPPSSTQRPNTAADMPRKKMAIEKIQPSSGILQSLGRRLADADQFGHRKVEHAERIGLADAQVHAERCRRYHPAAETGLCDRLASIK